MKRMAGFVACFALAVCCSASAQPPPPLARGQATVLLGTGSGYWGPLWGEPLHAIVFVRPLLRPSSQLNAYLALQPVTQGCTDSAASDHHRLYAFPQFFVGGQALANGTYESGDTVVSPVPEGTGVRTCLWLARSSHEPSSPSTHVVPLLNGAFAATITSLADPSGLYDLAYQYADFPSRRYPPGNAAVSCGADTRDSGLFAAGEGEDSQLGEGGCATSATFTGVGAGAGTIAYSTALATQQPPAVEHLGGCDASRVDGMTIAEAVYYMDWQGCTVDRLLPDGSEGPFVAVDGGSVGQYIPIGGGAQVETTLLPAGTHVDLEVPGFFGHGGTSPPKVPGQDTKPPPPGSECNDVATLSPSFAEKEKKLIELPSLSSADMPIALTAGVTLGSVGVCTRALEGSLVPSVDAHGLGIEFHYGRGKHEQTRSASYSFLPFDWRLPSDTGASSPGAAQIEWGGEVARGIEIRPSLSFGYSKGEKPEVSLDLISVPVAEGTATLLSQGEPFLNATIGPELTLGLKVDRRELELIEAEALASGLSAGAATEYVAQELRDEVAVAADEELPAVDPQPIDIQGVAPEMEQVQAEVVTDVTAEQAAAEQAATAFETQEIDNILTLPVRAVQNVEGDVVEVVEADPEVLLASASDHPAPDAYAARARRPRVPVTPLTSAHGRLIRAGTAKAAVLRRVGLRALHRAPLPRAQIAGTVHSVLTVAAAVRVGALAVTDTRLRPGASLDVVAVGLAPGAPHAATLVLDGPGYRATRLLEVRTGTAAASVTLPGSLTPGPWTIAIEDLSPLRASPISGRLAGAALARMGIFTVPARRQHRR